MVFTFNVEDRVPCDGSQKLFIEFYLNHIGVNEICFRHFALGNFKHLLRLVNTNYAKAFLNQVSGNEIAGSTTQIKNFTSSRQALKNLINVTQNSIYISFAPNVRVPTLRYVVVRIPHPD